MTDTTSPDAWADRARPRPGALVRLFDARLGTRLGARFAKVAAILLTLGYGIAIPFAARAPAGDGAASVLVNALGWLSWLAAGAIALSACGKQADGDALTSLALSRGFGPDAIAWARALSTARRIGSIVGVPALILALLALGFVRRFALLPARLALLPMTLGYVALVSVSFAALVQVARSLSAERTRWTFLLLVFVPHVLHMLLPQVPSLPWVLGRALDHLAMLGGKTL